ncbi:MAG: SPOR domain-containing protein [Pseudomonadota bacterium]
MLSRVTALCALFLTCAVSADSFDVQIGAFRNPDATNIKLPASVGELRRTSGPGGLTRFVVGPYDSRAAAATALATLKSAGFDGAFIRTSESSTGTVQVNASTRGSLSTPSSETRGQSDKDPATGISQSDLDRLMKLSEEERRDVVLLDGKLHRKVGDEFIPLRD